MARPGKEQEWADGKRLSQSAKELGVKAPSPRPRLGGAFRWRALTYRGAAGEMAFSSAWKRMSWLYYQYLLVTALYMLEPWERTVFSILYALFLFRPRLSDSWLRQGSSG